MIPPSQRETGTRFPGFDVALLLTLGALCVEVLAINLFIGLGPLGAAGLGAAFGIGGLATLAARRVGDPQAERIGLVALDARAVPLVLCLVPVVFIASELDNFAYDAWPGPARPMASAVTTTRNEAPPASDSEVEPTAEADVEARAQATSEPSSPPSNGSTTGDGAEASAIDRDDPVDMMQGLIVEVGIAPVVHEFLFRGVIQQGLVAQVGVARGVVLAATLGVTRVVALGILGWSVGGNPSTSPARFAVAILAGLAMEWLLGMVRLATGSILGPILLASAWAAIGFASFALESRFPVLGMNVEGTHLPLPITLGSLIAVTWGLVRVSKRVSERFPKPASEGAGR